MKMTFKLEGIGCAACAAKIEKAVGALEGVTSASVSFITEKMIIEGESLGEKTAESAVRIVKKYEPGVLAKRIK